MTSTSDAHELPRGDAHQGSSGAADSARTTQPLSDVLHCATCQAVTLDLSRLTCPVDSSHGIMGETRMTAPEVVAHWMFAGQADSGTGEGYHTPAAMAAGCDVGGHDYSARGTCEDCGHVR